MAFWQENYAFIKDVYDTRASKLDELMVKTDNAIKDVKADKLYTSAEFKKVKEIFAALAKNLEQPEIKDWLGNTKDMLMAEKSGKDKDAEAAKLNAILAKFDEMLPKIADTKAVVDCLWKCYQYTDELTPFLEWLEESIAKSTREINSNSVAETEEIMTRHEKNLDQLDKKKKVYMEQKTKAEKLANDPKSPKFMQAQLDRLNNLWKEANKVGDDRLDGLKKNLESWESYEKQRNTLDVQIDGANKEYQSTCRVYSLEGGPKEHTERLATASKMRKQIEDTFGKMSGANDELAKLLEDEKKSELESEVGEYRTRLEILNDMDEKLKKIDEFNGKIKEFDTFIKELEDWLPEGRKRMDDLLSPDNPIKAEDRVVQTMELQSDTTLEIEKMDKANATWSDELAPAEAGENTPQSQEFTDRMSNVQSTQGALLEEIMKESIKFGDDVKYLAEFTSGMKKFEPWITKAEAKKGQGMPKPNNLEEAQDYLTYSKTWKDEAEEMNQILEISKQSAQQMTSHADADAKYEAFKKRWVVIDATAKDWIGKYEKMVDVWAKQAETAAKVTAAISAPKGGDGKGQEMNLNDLEGHLNALKEMFIQKQKMMDELEKVTDAPPAAAPAAAEPAVAPTEAPAAEAAS
jgi:hypothetical protein